MHTPQYYCLNRRQLSDVAVQFATSVRNLNFRQSPQCLTSGRLVSVARMPPALNACLILLISDGVLSPRFVLLPAFVKTTVPFDISMRVPERFVSMAAPRDFAKRIKSAIVGYASYSLR